MRVAPLLIGLAGILSGLAIPLFLAVWVLSSTYRRARLDALLAEPQRLTGIGWPILAAFILCLALIIGGVVFVSRSLRRA